MNLSKCSAGIVLYTSSFWSSPCVVSINKSCRTHLTMICLKIFRRSSYDRSEGRARDFSLICSSGAGATNFWKGAGMLSHSPRDKEESHHHPLARLSVLHHSARLGRTTVKPSWCGTIAQTQKRLTPTSPARAFGRCSRAIAGNRTSRSERACRFLCTSAESENRCLP